MNPKIFIGCYDIAGIFSGLYTGFKDLRIQCTIFLPHVHPFQYSTLEDIPLTMKVLNQLFVFLYRKPKGIFKLIGGGVFFILKWLIMIFYFPFVFFKHDVFIFTSGITFFEGIELPLYRLFGKKVIAVFTGSDSRPSYFAPNFHGTNISKLVKKAKKQKNHINRLEKYDVICINYNPIAIFHSKPFINYLYLGVPLNRKTHSEPYKKKRHKILKILHSPSNPEAKGTKDIIKVIDEINSKEKKVELVLLKGVPNNVVIEKIQEADFVVDQKYSDVPMAIFAAEAAFFGTPTLVCGDYAEQLLLDYDKSVLPPTLYVLPENMKDGIIKMIENKEYRIEMGIKAKEFVRNKWSPKQVAKNYLRIINDDIPTEWIQNPFSLSVISPIGDKKVVALLVKSIIDKYGFDSLQIDDKPEIKKGVMDLIEKFS